MSELTLHTSSGKLEYSRGPTGGYKLIVAVDQSIVDYYRALLPKWVGASPQKYRAHISVVRKERPAAPEHWGKYEGELVYFRYSNVVDFSDIYCWLNVYSRRLEQVREELGLPADCKFGLPTNGYRKKFHCTIGNFK